MFTFMVFWYVFVLALPLALAWEVGRGEARPSMPPNIGLQAEKALKVARRRAVISVVVFGVAALLILVLSSTTALFSILDGGRILACAPCLAITMGLLAYAIYPVKDLGGMARQSASLTPRRWSNSLTRGATGGWIVAVAALISVTIGFGLTSSVDELGRHRAYTAYDSTGRVLGTASPYPGWFYTVPVVVTVLVLALVTWFALRQTSSAPSLPGVGLEHADARWRRDSADIILRLSAGALFLQSGALSWFGFNAIQNVRSTSEFNGGRILSGTFFDGLGSSVAGPTALALTIAGIAYLFSAFFRAISLPSRVIREQEIPNSQVRYADGAVGHGLGTEPS